jgi:toxin ParE1/3/4
MRRLKVEYQATAIDDLREIYRFVATQSQHRETARDFIRRIKARCSRIGFVPHGGLSRDDLVAGLRTVPFEHAAVITYIVEDDKVRIVNIFHGRRDFESFYLGFPANDDKAEE